MREELYFCDNDCGKEGNIIHIKTGKVGKQIKSDVWYELKNNKFVTVK